MKKNLKKTKIIQLYEQGKTIAQISKETNSLYPNVHVVISDYRKDKTIKNLQNN